MDTMRDKITAQVKVDLQERFKKRFNEGWPSMKNPPMDQGWVFEDQETGKALKKGITQKELPVVIQFFETCDPGDIFKRGKRIISEIAEALESREDYLRGVINCNMDSNAINSPKEGVVEVLAVYRFTYVEQQPWKRGG